MYSCFNDDKDDEGNVDTDECDDDGDETVAMMKENNYNK